MTDYVSRCSDAKKRYGDYGGDVITVSEFVQRQTPNSQFSHFDGSWNELVQRVWDGMESAIPGYRDGVVLVDVDPEGFHAAVVDLEEGDEFGGVYEPRQPGEEPRCQIFVKKEKQPAESVQIVLYSHEVLAENNEQSSDADWEIISINASIMPPGHEMPMRVGTMLANHFQVSGGTATGWSDEELVAKLRESFMFWRDKALAKPSEGER
jgi:hypothetical protein